MIFGKTVEQWEALNGYNTANEINQQADTWLKTFDLVRNQKNELSRFIEPFKKSGKIIFSGAGTSEFVGSTLVPMLQEKYFGRVHSIATTDIVADPKQYISPTEDILVVSFGRSGNSPESIATVDLANQINPNTKHLIITCNHEGSLALRDGEAYYSIKLPPETNDKSFAMTSSYTNMILSAYMTFNLDKLEDIKKDLDDVVVKAKETQSEDYKIVDKLIQEFDFERIVFLGDNEMEALSHEASLKMLELTAGDIVVAYNTPLGFRHGPKSIINKSTLLVSLMSNNDYTRKYQIDLIKEVASQRKGNQIMVLDQRDDAFLKEQVDIYKSFSYYEENKLAILNFAIIVQLMGLFKSLHENKGPDNPWPSGEVNRVVQGVILYDYKGEI